VDAIGTNGTTVADTATGVAGMIGVNDADNAMDTSSVVENGDGSVYERLEALRIQADDVLAALGSAGVGVGSVFYVDSVTGSDADAGTSWALAEATLSAALGDATANKGDIIFVAPNHTEALADAQLAVNKAGVKIIGLGVGDNRPEFTFGHANSSWLVSVADVWIENVIFRATITGVVIGVNFSNTAAHYCTLKNCLFEDTAGSGGEEFLIAVSMVAGVDMLTIDGCEFVSPDAGATDAISCVTGVCDRLTIKNCRIVGDYSTAGITSTQINTHMFVANNVIDNSSAGDYTIKLTAAATGELVNNRLYSNAYATCLDPGSLKCTGNLAVDAIDEGG